MKGDKGLHVGFALDIANNLIFMIYFPGSQRAKRGGGVSVSKLSLGVCQVEIIILLKFGNILKNNVG